MEYTANEILGINNVLGFLSTKEMPRAASYSIITDIAKIKTILSAIDKVRADIVAKYTTKDDSGKAMISEENQPKANSEFLMFINAKKETVDFDTKLKKEDLDSIEKIKAIDLEIIVNIFMEKEPVEEVKEK